MRFRTSVHAVSAVSGKRTFLCGNAVLLEKCETRICLTPPAPSVPCHLISVAASIATLRLRHLSLLADERSELGKRCDVREMFWPPRQSEGLPVAGGTGAGGL